MRKFFLCADDYALTRGVSEGILAAACQNVLSGTSAMTNQADWPNAAREWKGAAPKAKLGLHLNLTLGQALTAISFGDRGTFPPLRLLARLLRDQRHHSALCQEIDAQIDAFIAEYGAMPAFIDGHQHVQILPMVRACLIRVLKERALPKNFWIRNSVDKLWRILARGGQAQTKALVVSMLGHGLAGDLKKNQLATNDSFAGFSLFRSDQTYESMFIRYLSVPGKTHVVMCHPGRVDAALLQCDPVTTTRAQELAFLTSERFRLLLEKQHWQLSEDL